MVNSTTNISMLNIEELMVEMIKVWRGLTHSYLEEICTSIVLFFLWLDNQTILLIMQYNFCFAYSDVFI